MVLQSDPDDSAAIVARAELLLGQAAYLAPAEQAATVPAGDPVAGVARRLELCGLIAGEQLAAAHTALQRAAGGGLARWSATCWPCG